MPDPRPTPFLYDSEQLQAIAADGTVANGLADFRNHRVTELFCEGLQLQAEVEQEKGDERYQLQLDIDDDGTLSANCGCQSDEAICRHAIAALYAYNWEQNNRGEIRGAADTALQERIQRGRNEVKVNPLHKKRLFGEWRAQSLQPSGHVQRDYRVHLRSLSGKSNSCSCPDFATNQLGTCKHIEAVLHHISKRSGFKKMKQEGPPFSYLALDWEVESAPQIRLHLSAATENSTRKLLQPWFSEQSLFTGQLPGDLYPLLRQLEGREDFEIGADITTFLEHESTRLSHQQQSREIAAQIIASQGHLPGVEARLYPYQVEGVAFLAATGRALLADDMGLGKTLQAISAATWLRRTGRANKILIITPASLKQQWANEIERFTGAPTQIIQGSPKARQVQYRQGDRFYIINYELLLRDDSVINEILSPDLLILDEAQRIKNWRTKIASAVKNIASRYTFVLTGTPLENRLEDLYSLMQVIDPQVLGPLWRYLVDFHLTDERGKVLGYRNLSELRRRLQPVMLRRDRRLVQDQLPERIQQRFDIELSPQQLELHDSALQAAGTLAQIAKRRPLTPSEQNRMMSALQQARMACDAAALVDEKLPPDSPKLDEMELIIEQVCLQEGRKAVIFSQWEKMTQLVEQRLQKMGVGSIRLHGGVPTAKRGALIDRFRDEDEIQVFISTDAGGVGLNLQCATLLINLDIPWNPAVLEQRIARIHRLGQRETVHIILMVASGGYEGRVYSLVANKQHLFDQVIAIDAQEDVVGVSSKLLDTVINDLAPQEAGEKPPQEESVAESAAELNEELPTTTERPSPPKQRGDSALEEAISALILRLQQQFGERIERIMGSGGGLLVLMEQVGAADHQQLEEIAHQSDQTMGQQIPLALIDTLTLRGLQQLGDGSPLPQATTYFENANRPPPPSRGERLRQQALERLESAALLLQQPATSPAMELILSALLTAATARTPSTEAHSAITRESVTLWLHTQALPNRWLTAEEAALIMRAIGLQHAPELPPELGAELLRESRLLVESLN
ncbi:MAG: DEAD/DEAH box helicase [Gammaproteobacteria bacterium]|nr:DEAD/DEAH box helicase [Gammaproteobacteria bacterium]